MPELEPNNIDRRKQLQVALPPQEKTKKAFRLLHEYSKIPHDQIEPHIVAIRNKAFEIFPYVCIGRWGFLSLNITNLPTYSELVSRGQNGAVILDCGCCFGQALRQLAFDGVPQENLVGLDLRQEFIDLGFELFKDSQTWKGKFVAGDLLACAEGQQQGLDEVVDGKVDIIHVASVFHLFGWDDQVTLGVRMVKFFRGEGAKGRRTVVGRQVGNSEEPLDPKEHERLGLGRYHHNEASLQRLWDVIGERTGTTWAVEAGLEMVESDLDGLLSRELTMITFAVRQV
ncbi:hypothetical protein QBC43DRAFT_349767 [Cladorrhinum sp. PSN259]|nr:hypothetical protein QBC43DRAFT_349767 [Cladorrhinum sp. PSN259]